MKKTILCTFFLSTIFSSYAPMDLIAEASLEFHNGQAPTKTYLSKWINNITLRPLEEVKDSFLYDNNNYKVTFFTDDDGYLAKFIFYNKNPDNPSSNEHVIKEKRFKIENNKITRLQQIGV